MGYLTQTDGFLLMPASLSLADRELIVTRLFNFPRPFV